VRPVLGLNMPSAASNTIGWIVLWACLAFGIKLVQNYFSKRSAEKREAERRATLKAHREEREDKRPTMLEALDSELNISRRLALPNEDEAQRNNALYARIVMEDDLGRYAEGPRPYADLDQDHRDILLVHARRDVAEALATSQTLLREVRRLTSALDDLARYAFWVMVAFLLWSWWKSGFAVWWQQ
jgi:hypothetical protein